MARLGAACRIDPPSIGVVMLATMRRLSLLLLASCSSAPPIAEHVIPLNLDLSVPGIVDRRVPWGWSFVAAGWVGVDASADVDSGRLAMHRAEAGADAQLVYDLADPFAGRRLTFRGTIHADAGATLRLGVRVLDEGWRMSEAFSDWRQAGSVEAELTAPPDSYNVQLLVEYRGSGAAHVGSLALALDGRTAGPVLPDQPAADPRIVDWIRQRAIPLRTADPDEPLDDLDALRPLIGDRRVLLLGESTHGSAEFFTWKARFVRRLAGTGEPIVFVIEDHPDKADRIDRFIRTGAGDAATAVKGLFAFWGRQETVDLVRWMREATAAGQIRLTFAGVDLQVPLGPIQRIAVAASELDAELAERVAELLRPMRAAWEQQRYPQREAEEYRRWIAAALRVRDELEKAGASERTMFDARLVRQSAEVSAAGGDIRTRDRFMADNFVWLREHSPPDARFVVWAHNTHVRRDESAMGQFLAERYPEEVLAVGLFTDRGSYVGFDGRELRTYELFPGPPGSFEEALRLSGHEMLALDLRGSGDVLAEPMRHRNIGLWPADLGFYPAVIPAGFDAAVYIGRTTPTRPMAAKE